MIASAGIERKLYVIAPTRTPWMRESGLAAANAFPPEGGSHEAPTAVSAS
jgi:hypothetical protein